MDPNSVSYFAQTDSRNQRIPFGIKSKDRSRHVYVIGKTGMGKSTLLENLAVTDIQNGSGMAFIDPHGKTADLLLEYVPQHRIKDVIYFAPFDIEYPISFNVMEDVGADKRHLIANGLMSAFKKLFGEESFSDRMQYILQNTILALLEYPDATMLGINKMLAEKDFRNAVIANITDPSVKTYWTKEYAGYTERFAAEAIPAIQNKIGQFTSNPLVRNIIGQPKSSFDIRKVMDENKILIVNLSKGRVGEANANLLGSMLITKIYLGAMSRADASERALGELPQFYLFVDEFQNFANESFADILSEARKYKLNLTIAHQYIEQMSEEVRAAVFGNVGTMIVFRVGAYDAEVLEKEFAPTFAVEDLVNLGFVQIYLKLMIDGVTSQPFSATTLPPIKKGDISFKDDIIENSRKVFAKPKAVVEQEIFEVHKPVGGDSKSFKKPEIRQDSRPEVRQERRPDPRPEIKQEAKAPLPKTSSFPTTTPAPVQPQPKPYIPPPAPPVQKVEKEIEKAKPNPFEALKVSNDGRIFVKPNPVLDPNNQNSKGEVLLSKLKQESQKPRHDHRAPTPQNTNNLKQALASIVQKAKPEVKPEIKKESKPEQRTEAPKTPVPNSTESRPKHEVPEDVLRKMLEI